MRPSRGRSGRLWRACLPPSRLRDMGYSPLPRSPGETPARPHELAALGPNLFAKDRIAARPPVLSPTPVVGEADRTATVIPFRP